MADTRVFHSYEMSSNGVEKPVQQTSYEAQEAGTILSSSEWAEIPEAAKKGFTANDQRDMRRMGKKQEFRVRSYRVKPTSFTMTDWRTEELQIYHYHWFYVMRYGHLGDFAHVCYIQPESDPILTNTCSANTQGLIAGGLSGLFWSLCWTYLGQFFIVLSLAEMAAMAPTAGGQYHWVSEFAPRKYQKVLSYISGNALAVNVAVYHN
jgi:choline transport protein